MWWLTLASVSQCVTLCADPHLTLAHGGRADFRGRHDTLYNILSAGAVSVNAKTENATFRLGKVTVHGSFVTEVHVVAGGVRRARAGLTGAGASV